MALERKYLFGEIIEQCYTLLDSIETSVDDLFPYAQHGALLYSVLQRINLLSPDNYQFSVDIIHRLFDQLIPFDNEKKFDDENLWKDEQGKNYDFVYLFDMFLFSLNF